ncbi:type II toxin-antitoxin system PemK/MazF family toxin [Streptomyces sp. NPDC127072]|uniref:type II toxin-antitoxin system PemK/MazF family toxin n=1 Tax=Streptomyces sp. NPDC127072 TaxID=3347129 RepID=UPI0036597ADB
MAGLGITPRTGPKTTNLQVRHSAVCPGPVAQLRPIRARLPFEENDGRGKDRPVLVVAREAAGTFLAVQLSSKRHDGDREWVPIGSGPWDRTGRDSWVAVDRVLRLHEDGMRREACALDRMRFNSVVHRLRERYGWR